MNQPQEISPKDATEIKEISVRDFHDLGFLQEVNRQFLHPHGLALSVRVDQNGHATEFGQIWDYRDDPEGIEFADGVISTEKAANTRAELERHEVARFKHFGALVQPVAATQE